MNGRRIVVMAILTAAIALVPVLGAVPPGPPLPVSTEIAGPRSLTGEPPALPPRPPPSLVGAGQGRLFVTTSDPSVVPNDGLRTNLTAFAPRSLDRFSSFQEAVAETIGGYDAVFGLFENDVRPPVAFFSVYSNTTDQTVHLAYWTNLTLLTGASYDFQLTRTAGTVWTLRVNGGLFGANGSEATFDFGATDATWAGGLSFSEIALYPNATSAPPMAAASLVFAVRTPGGWYLPTLGVAAFTGTAPWGIEGRVQHPTLAPGASVSGTSISPVPNGTLLWSGGPVSVRVTISVPSEAVGLTAVAVWADVRDDLGAPIPGAALFLHDDLGGNFTPASSATNGSGGTYAAFGTPNVTSNASDLVSAIVTTFGYRGFASVAMAVSAPRHVLITVSGAPTVPPGGSATIALRTTDVGGAGIGAIYLVFSAAGGTVSADFALTGSEGLAAVTVATTASSGTLTLYATVTTPGAWGSLVLHLPIRASASSVWASYGPPLAAGAAAIAAVGLVVWAVRRRPPPKTSEQLWGPSLRREAAPPVSRTPPGSGGP